MSNFLAIATVTAALSQLLRTVLPPDVSGAEVTTLRPGATSAVPKTGVNIYLYQVTEDPASRNLELPTRGSDGTVVQRPRIALDLHYLLSFYGDEGQLQTQRLLASTMRTLHERPVLTRELIRSTIKNDSFSYLAKSDLAQQIESVRFSHEQLSLEELAKLWSVLLQTVYPLSVAYVAKVVWIESDIAPTSPLPVRKAAVFVQPFQRIVIEQVQAEAGPGAPIVGGSRISVLGKGLRGATTTVMIGDNEVAPALDDIGDTKITVALPPLAAGVHAVQVVHPMMMGEPPVAHAGAESNVAAFVLQPTIKKGAGGFEIKFVAGDSTAHPPVPNKVEVKVAPDVGREQPAALLLTQVGGTGLSYRFNADARTADTEVLTFSVAGAKASDYLVRVRVSDAESALDLTVDPQHLPKVTIP